MIKEQEEASIRSGRQLKEIRLAAGLSQESLASDANIDQSLLSKAERLGIHMIRWNNIHAIAEALDCVIEVTFRKI